jgi:hypothetical protein
MSLDELEKLAKAATPGPWVWEKRREKERANVQYVEPYSDGSGFCQYDLISRDSGVYGPDVPTCEYIIACNPETVLKLIAVARAADEYSTGIITNNKHEKLREALLELEAGEGL